MKETRDRAARPGNCGYVYGRKVQAMLRRSFTAFFVFVLLPAVFCLILAGQAEAVGRFTHVEGRVDVLKEGKAPAVPARVGDAVSLKDVIRTRSDSRAEVAFADGNIVRIAERTRLDISEYAVDGGVSRAVLHLPRGRVNAIVEEKVAKRIAASPEANRFEIRTPVAVAGVRGTRFFMTHLRGATTVLVDTGVVAVQNPRFPALVVVVTAGNVSTVTEQQPPTPPRPATETEMKGHQGDTAPGDKVKTEDAKAKVKSAEVAALEQTVIGEATTAPPVGIAPTIESVLLALPPVIADVRPPITETRPEVLGDRIPLAFSGVLEGGFMLAHDPVTGDFLSMDEASTLRGLLSGKDSLWGDSPVPFVARGEFSNPRGGQFPFAYVDGITNDGGVFTGIFGGLSLGETADGRFLGIYIDPAGNTGFLMSDVAGLSYVGISTWEAFGTLNIGPVGTTALPREYWLFDEVFSVVAGSTSGFFVTHGGGSISSATARTSGLMTLNLAENPWGLWWTGLWGTYTGTTYDTWSAIDEGRQLSTLHGYVAYREMHITGTQWSNQRLAGAVTGFMADISAPPPVTGIFVGETLGTFNPATETWYAGSLGMWMETNKFLGMTATPSGQAKLQQLNIPAVEVGRVTLTGSGNNMTVNMNDVKFFAPSTGARPSIWATGSVTGTFTAAPVLGTQINLSDGTLFAAFTPQGWDTTNNRWLSTISGSGHLTGGAYTGSVQMRGAAAGTIIPDPVAPNTGTITGTAAGVAR